MVEYARVNLDMEGWTSRGACVTFECYMFCSSHFKKSPSVVWKLQIGS